MSHVATRNVAPSGPPYRRHQPEQTLLYQIVEQHYPEFREVMAAQGKTLPFHVQQEFADYLKCGRLELPHCHRTTTRPQGIHAADHPGLGSG
jgi:hypothetical protein